MYLEELGVGREREVGEGWGRLGLGLGWRVLGVLGHEFLKMFLHGWGLQEVLVLPKHLGHFHWS